MLIYYSKKSRVFTRDHVQHVSLNNGSQYKFNISYSSSDSYSHYKLPTLIKGITNSVTCFIKINVRRELNAFNFVENKSKNFKFIVASTTVNQIGIHRAIYILLMLLSCTIISIDS